MERPRRRGDRRSTALAEATLVRAAGPGQAHQLLVGAAVQHDMLASARLPEAAYAFVTTSLLAQDTYAAGGCRSRLRRGSTTRAATAPS